MPVFTCYVLVFTVSARASGARVWKELSLTAVHGTCVSKRSSVRYDTDTDLPFDPCLIPTFIYSIGHYSSSTFRPFTAFAVPKVGGAGVLRLVFVLPLR